MSGVEGVFRRCAEETMRVMRDSVETIMTVLEVCKHDPMHNWSAQASRLPSQTLPSQANESLLS
jgi:ataxia telangiectasia mutated family protein